MGWFSLCLRAGGVIALIVAFLATGSAAPLTVAPGSPLSRESAKRGFDLADIDPACAACDDFNRFAIGGWLDRHPIPPDRSAFGIFESVSERNDAVLQQILEVEAADPGATGDTKKIGDLYASCLDVEAIDRAGLEPVAPFLAKIAAIGDLSSFIEVVADLHRVGIGALWRSSSTIDAKDSRSEIAFVSPAGLGLPDRDFYLRDDPRAKDIRDGYVRYASTAFELAGDAPAEAAREGGAVLSLETRLARAQLSNVERQNPDNVYHLVARAELGAVAPHVAWDRYFAIRAFPPFAKVDLSQPGYAKSLDTILAQTPLADLKSYLRWRVLSENAQALPRRFAEADFAFVRLLSGMQAQLPRPNRCTRVVDRLMGDALGRLWVAKAFPPEAKSRAEEMVGKLKATLAADLQSLPWMGEQTRREALAKLNAMRPLIGYPKKWRDYGRLRIVRAGYLENVRTATAYGVDEEVAKIGKPVDPDEMGVSAPTVNAFYSLSRNAIIIPAGILQAPFFFADGDDALNYGAIGAVIGHEMTHAFDNVGRRFDADGNVRDWWTPQDAASFQSRAECIVDQYGTYKVGDGVNVNGRLVQGEAIADLGGATIAYQAMERALEGKRRASIDGYTQEQRFFLAFARFWAGSRRPERARTLALTDPHPPNNYRVDGTLANMPEFALAFRCKAIDAMVHPPASRCKIW